jgi:hypothetical protein
MVATARSVDVTGLYYTQMVDAARAAGLNVQIPAVCNGWERRARSSGGFPSPPLGVWWHHTASNTAPANDLNYMINGSADAPVGNWLIDRAGVCYPIAAGASNCAGKSEATKPFSRGSCPVSQGNTRGWQIEVANSGVGGAGGDWSVATIDALFGLSGVLNALAGNRPDDIISHALGAGDGYTNRKIDPARAESVQGPWRPRSTNSSATWSLADMRAEANRRAAYAPTPPTPEVPDMTDDQARQLAELWQYCTQTTGAPGQFTDPGGADLNLPWAAAWCWSYVSGTIDAKLNEIMARLDALEA